jgi:two-component system chemotaxis sensor kinase CheA
MCKKLNKEVELKLVGEETEVDKNIIEHISDPLMHLIRNSIDHGIETSEERINKGKSQSGTLTLSAQNAGSDIIIKIKDDGRGLNREKILKKAKEHELIYKPENEMSDKEVFSLILLPGFSTKDNISEFSGRGVGMDVVVKSIEAVGGTVSIESMADAGTTIIMKIPLTLAIINGMNIRVGNAMYTIPTISIRESFRAVDKNIIIDPEANEMIMVRGQCYPVLRLHEHFKVKTNVMNITEGIIVMVENGDDSICIFADELVGEQQVVVKTLPAYIRNIRKIRGLAGCTLLGDGSISLILDTAGFFEK